MNALLKTNENIVDIAIAYFDESDEMLKEITQDNLYFALSALSFQYKRLYLIGDLMYTSSIKITAIIVDDPDEEYTIKLNLNKDFNNVADFNDSTNSVSGTFDNQASRYLNAMPLDILISSNNITEVSKAVEFTLEFGDNPEVPQFVCYSTYSSVRWNDFGESVTESSVEIDGVNYDTFSEALELLSDVLEYDINYGSLTNISNKVVSLRFNRRLPLYRYEYNSGVWDELSGYTYFCLQPNNYSMPMNCQISTQRNYVSFDRDSYVNNAGNYEVTVNGFTFPERFNNAYSDIWFARNFGYDLEYSEFYYKDYSVQTSHIYLRKISGDNLQINGSTDVAVVHANGDIELCLSAQAATE